MCELVAANILQKSVSTRLSFMLMSRVPRVMAINYVQLAIAIDTLRCYLGKFRESFGYRVLPPQKAL